MKYYRNSSIISFVVNRWVCLKDACSSRVNYLQKQIGVWKWQKPDDLEKSLVKKVSFHGKIEPNEIAFFYCFKAQNPSIRSNKEVAVSCASL